MSSTSNARDATEAREAQQLYSQCAQAVLDGRDSDCIARIDASQTPSSHVDVDDVFRYNAQGKTLLHVACSKGRVAVVRYILGKTKHKSALLELADEDGFTPLINATVSESTELMQLLCSEGAVASARTRSGVSALHYAACDGSPGSTERMQLLLDRGADINCASQTGTPLHWAACHFQLAAAEFLLARGANVNAPSGSGPPAFTAAASGSDSIVALLLRQPSIDLSLARHGDLHLLHLCAEHGLLESVRAILLLDHSLATLPTSDGNLPIDLAAMSQQRAAVELLQPYSGERFSDAGAVDRLMGEGGRKLAEWHAKHAPAESKEARAGEGGESAEEEASRLVLEGPASAEAAGQAEELKARGNQLFADKRFEEAIAAYSAAIALSGTSHLLWSNRSACHLAVHNPKAALYDGLVCRRLKPDWAKGCYRVAVARLALGLFEDAAVAAFEGCKLDDANQDLKKLLREAVARGREAHAQQLQRAGQ